MQRSLMHQCTFLVSLALLALTSCTTHSDAKSSPQSARSATNSSQTEPTPVVATQLPGQPTERAANSNLLNTDPKTNVLAAESATKPSSAQPTGNLLSPAQVAKLTKLPIPIVAPSYLPDGFRVVLADGESGQYANGDDDSGYSIEYRRNDNTCFAIASSKDGPRRLPLVGQVTSAIGVLKIYEEAYENRRSLHSFIPVKGNPVMTSPISHLNPATGKYEACKALNRAEYERILTSIELVK